MLVIIFSVLFSLSSAEECSQLNLKRLRHLAAPEGEKGKANDPEVADIVGLGIPTCLSVLDQHSYYDTPWCSCFKFPEVIDLITEDFGDCQLTDEPHSNFPIAEAITWCDERTNCTEVTYHSVCESKNCIWDEDTSTCTGVNPDRFDNNAVVQTAATELEVPWVDGCDMLVAVYDQYLGSSCNDPVPEMQRTLEEENLFDPQTEVFNVTLRDVCGETCWFQDKGAPYVFDREDNCTSHLDCNGGDPDVHDYFCANCDECKRLFADSTDDCGVCHLTKYESNVCVEMKRCTAGKSFDGKCASQRETGVTTGNFQCYSDDTTFMYDIESCKLYTQNLDDDDVVRQNACPCHTDENFQALDCIFRRSKLYTLKETQQQCQQPCNQTMSRDACLSAASVENSPYDCVWLNRLVKGLCVDNPCQGESAADCTYDACLRCDTNALGEQSCVVSEDKVGASCDDKNPETDRDVCGAQLYLHQDENKPFACEGVNAVQRLEEPKKLCDPGFDSFDDCCTEGEMYVCDPFNKILNYTVFAGGHCDNATIATYYWIMDGNCSNVITTEAKTRNIYFSGNCSEDEARAWECSEQDYLSHLEIMGGTFIPFDDSAGDFSIFLGTFLLLLYLI